MALRSYANGALFAEVSPDDRPRVLALHGWGRRATDYRLSLDGLGYVAPDLPGFGTSPPPKTLLGATGYAHIVAELIEEFDRPPVLVGHSFGGRIAVCLAAARPSDFAGLVLTGVPLLRTGPSPRVSPSYRLIRRLNRIGLVSDERLEKERRRRGSADYRAATGVMRDILVKVIDESYEEELGSLQGTVSLLWGGDDSEVPVRVAERALPLLTSADRVTLDIVPGVGHLLPLEAPARLREVIDSMLR